MTTPSTVPRLHPRVSRFMLDAPDRLYVLFVLLDVFFIIILLLHLPLYFSTLLTLLSPILILLQSLTFFSGPSVWILLTSHLTLFGLALPPLLQLLVALNRRFRSLAVGPRCATDGISGLPGHTRLSWQPGSLPHLPPLIPSHNPSFFYCTN